MIKFVNKIDGAIFYAEDGSILYAVLINDDNYEIVEEELDVSSEEEKSEETPKEPTEEVEAPVEEGKPKRGTKKEGA